ncbi:MAG: DEAD/DEAH box helicase family protein [Candidatus Altimarinota bacterium]
MLASEKILFTKLKKNETFLNLMKKVMFQNQLSYNEQVYLLSVAITFLKEYENDNEKKLLSYADFSYYLILHYTIITSDYKPLYDFSINFGFYPITNEILKLQNINDINIFDLLTRYSINDFKSNEGGYIETLEQKILSQKVLSDKGNEKSYIAPTSFGKSSLITEIIKQNQSEKKIVIVVPTKSLLTQTYKNILKSNLEKKIILHDGMYDNEESFIAILTQERALKIMQLYDISYDLIIIDEAHNLFDSDYRAILLSRLLKKNFKLNQDHKVVYLSPLIMNSDNLKITSNQIINSYNIKFNIKEPTFYEYNNKTKKTYLFNRFLGDFYEVGGAYTSWIEYVQMNSENKNFLYESKPRDIEKLALKLSEELDKMDTNKQLIEEIKATLKDKVHDKFYIITTIDSGVLYLHGKLPDIVKEYIESKFKKIPELKYIVGNNVILEGVNLPINTLFVSGYYKLSGKKLINLIGRVNRLSEVFNQNSKFDFKNLTPKIHFFNKGEQEHLKKVKDLRSRLFEDDITNPTLDIYDLDYELSLLKNEDKKLKLKEKVDCIKSKEDYLLEVPTTLEGKIKKDLIELGIHSHYVDIDILVIDIKNYLKNHSLKNSDVIEEIHKVFFSTLGNISDFEFKRFNYPETRNYYSNYILITSKKTLKQNITDQYNYLIEKSKTENPLLYIGTGYGEIPYPSSTDGYNEPFKNSYIDLRQQDETKLVNISIIKIKMEEDFISFVLSKFIDFLLKYNLVEEKDYNKYIYGTEEKSELKLVKAGLNTSLINRLKNDNQIQNLDFDKNNNLICNNNFKEFLTQIDDFYKFEITKFLPE